MNEPKPIDSRSKPAPLAESLPEESIKVSAKPAPAVYGARTVPRVADPELDAHMRQANLLRIRGDLSGAIKEIENAGPAAQSNALALETLGDLFVAMGSTDDALVKYQTASQLGASATVEAKIARILIKQKGAGSYANDSGALYKLSGPATMTASAVIPGLGLAMGGEYQIAAITFFGWFITLALMFVLPGSHDAIQAFSGHFAPSKSGTATLIFLGLINFGFWVYSMIETARLTKAADKDG